MLLHHALVQLKVRWTLLLLLLVAHEGHLRTTELQRILRRVRNVAFRFETGTWANERRTLEHLIKVFEGNLVI